MVHSSIVQARARSTLAAWRATHSGQNVDAFNGVHPDTDQGYIAAAGKLKQMVERFRIVAALQRDGLIDVHTASEKKDALSREMRSGPIAHMAQVGRETAARSMAAKPSAVAMCW